jgi:succinate-semialdehyde dehydrogenase / glutarate-semialdehyde dehydrogenase
MAFDIIDPTTGQKLRTYEVMDRGEIDEILDRTFEVQRSWRRTTFAERGGLMLAVADKLEDEKHALAALMADEMGKILTQGVAEIEKCAWVCRYYAEHAESFLSREPVETEAYKSFVDFRPLGVILAIMPWNYPFWQVFRFAAPTLMAGNAALLKHAPNVIGCALAIERLFREAGFPSDLFRTLVIDIPETTEVIHDRRVAAVTITSSVAAGRAVASEAGKALKKCVLELGGSDPFIVLEDANIDRAVEVGIVGRFQNSGQSCIAAKRFIVVDPIYDEFEAKFVEAVRGLEMGDPRSDDVFVGPQARMDLRDGLADQLRRSVEAGARVLVGGEVPEGPGAFYPPTVLAGVKPGMAAWSEELFGPVATLIRVRDEAEALEVANGTAFGLSGAVWTEDLERGERIAAEGIESGAAFVNDMSKSDPRLPFGGIRDSGYGRELSTYGIREFVNIHAVSVNRSSVESRR